MCTHTLTICRLTHAPPIKRRLIPNPPRPGEPETQSLSLSHPIPSPVTRSRKSSSSHARATLTLTAPDLLFRLPSFVRFSRRRLSRAHPTHVLLSTAHCKVHVRVPSARACGRCARRGWCVRLSPTSASSSPMHQQQAQAAHLIATVNGRTYTRYALGLCTGLSRDASSH